ncbi:hypothetical protein A11A3_04400 [Alcanivorax hongdengensis A-11-3]|uniref:Proteophosphoglycan n=1 Tax=Alcanivorax hongdengensis A-11-3 TaxID=1177179 RepID=L0WH71_9GAMM|nr:DUF1285 domain-containing protein [Alcanivorax hongdengensis]EKF75190.1 hypothetical protein A11A3_04400 [Alcanivorax hongdengensis A-11-3]
MTAPDDLLALLEKAAEDESGLPPVHQWKPEHEADVAIRIARDGRWYYQDSPIERQRMVNLFSTILLREGKEYFLVTPVEKLRIQVEDAPFVAVEVEKVGDGDDQKLVFRTNVDSHVVAGPRHPIRVTHDAKTGEPSPYLLVRDNLQALINRTAFYQLVEWGECQDDHLMIRSEGTAFELGKLT